MDVQSVMVGKAIYEETTIKKKRIESMDTIFLHIYSSDHEICRIELTKLQLEKLKVLLEG